VSQENVELVRGWYAFLPDLAQLDPAEDARFLDRAFRDYLDEAFEVRLPADYPEGEPRFRGREGFGQMAAMLRDAWSEWHFEAGRLLDTGDKVVVFVRVTARGSGSGVPFELPSTHVVTLREGRMISAHVYRDRSEALKAVGLEE
jgi:ketosteroid isomerase-like protein